MGVPEDRQLREIRRHTRTQSQFLRLRRTKIGLRDFRTVKVIGKGAFGEVSFWPGVLSLILLSFASLSLAFSTSCPAACVAWGTALSVFFFGCVRPAPPLAPSVLRATRGQITYRLRRGFA